MKHKLFFILSLLFCLLKPITTESMESRTHASSAFTPLIWRLAGLTIRTSPEVFNKRPLSDVSELYIGEPACKRSRNFGSLESYSPSSDTAPLARSSDAPSSTRSSPFLELLAKDRTTTP